ncbi:N-acetyltransferase [Micromonospora sp. NPDC093277]|uniref:N-acetyltransferase n=1 Tax=Micromonospora sp. NPDC093277 TaxID=3364291 RepID=UPI0037F2046E
MESNVRIRAAHWTDKDTVAGLIADAMQPSPLAEWLVPDPQQRRQILADVALIWVEHAMFFGDVHLTDDLTATTVGFHRYRPIPPPANHRTRLTDVAGSHADRFHLLHRLVAQRQPTEPHYDLAFFAVHPNAQKAGHGAALLAHHRDRIDRVDLPSWTTTPTDGQPLLARHGYTPRPAITLPDGPTLHPMRRNPPHASSGDMPTNPTHTVDNRWQDFHA